MKERYVSAPEDVEFVDRLIANSVNLLGYIYGRVYFPTFSNSLKEVGRYLGFEWCDLATRLRRRSPAVAACLGA
jgi:predicted RecB family nuclease